MSFIPPQYNFNNNPIQYNTPNQVGYNTNGNAFNGNSFYPNNGNQSLKENKSQIPDPDQIKKQEKDHFDFVNNLFKKK